MIRRNGIGIVACALVLAACSSSSAPQPSADAGTAQQLTTLAAHGATATYAATYLFHQSSPNSTATVQVWHAPPNLRVDILSGSTTATFLRTAAATYSCALRKAKPARKECFTVAKSGQKVPAPFDVGPASLFTDDLETLAASGTSYLVTAGTAQPAGDGVPSASCFAVKPGVLTPTPAVQNGTYCFSAQGVLVAVTYPSGNTARMTRLDPAAGAAPATLFRPYAKPAPLPS